MTAHRALPTPALGRNDDLVAPTGTNSGYCNLFGDAPAQECYRGFGFDEAGRLKNRQMFRWLAARFAEPYNWPGGDSDNRRISAGYTYFAQFVIHDVVLSLADLPDVKTGTTWPRNYRSSRLMLDAIYGMGPLADPLFYGPCPVLPGAKSFLRISGKGGAGPLRDLPRSPCPFGGKAAYSDVLIADARNDDNVIIAQITVIFHLLHNIVYSALANKSTSEPDPRTFALARRVVTRIYRQIVIDDLLKKLLHPAIYDAFWDQRNSASRERGDPRMPLEFSHAAARFGHFMARDRYQINDDPDLQPDEQGIKNMLRQTSAIRPEAMPLAPKWLVDWTTLFDKTAPARLRARRFGPAMAPALIYPDLFPNADDPAMPPGDIGGLVYRDLLRGGEANLRSVRSIVEKLPANVTALSPLVKEGAVDPAPVVAWLKAGRSGDPAAIDDEYMSCIAGDIPLLLFILIEAAETNLPDADIRTGECLGPVGSWILADFFFGEYSRTRTLVEEDAASLDALNEVFEDDPPASMPALIQMISDRQSWSDVSPKFW